MIQQTHDNLTISQIIAFWQRHSVDDKKLADSIKDSYTKIVQKHQLDDADFNIRNAQWYKDSDTSKFYVAINVKEDSLQIVEDTRNLDNYPDLVGYIEVTKNQFDFLQVLTIDEQIASIIKFVKETQLMYATSLDKIFLNINQAEGLNKDQSNDIFIAHNLHFVSDDELTKVWHTDIGTVRKTAGGDLDDLKQAIENLNNYI